jgi:hypothetical protein
VKESSEKMPMKRKPLVSQENMGWLKWCLISGRQGQAGWALGSPQRPIELHDFINLVQAAIPPAPNLAIRAILSEYTLNHVFPQLKPSTAPSSLWKKARILGMDCKALTIQYTHSLVPPSPLWPYCTFLIFSFFYQGTWLDVPLPGMMFPLLLYGSLPELHVTFSAKYLISFFNSIHVFLLNCEPHEGRDF